MFTKTMRRDMKYESRPIPGHGANSSGQPASDGIIRGAAAVGDKPGFGVLRGRQTLSPAGQMLLAY